MHVLSGRAARRMRIDHCVLSSACAHVSRWGQDGHHSVMDLCHLSLSQNGLWTKDIARAKFNQDETRLQLTLLSKTMFHEAKFNVRLQNPGLDLAATPHHNQRTYQS